MAVPIKTLFKTRPIVVGLPLAADGRFGLKLVNQPLRVFGPFFRVASRHRRLSLLIRDHYTSSAAALRKFSVKPASKPQLDKF